MHRLALYLRLSLEDEKAVQNGPESCESNSIASQRKQIYEYIENDAELRGYEKAEFTDDGYSGTDMNRPGMRKLLGEVKANRICCIIVKDMSRFSRDYVEMGTYLNQIFPFMGIRFIAINDHYDSREHHGSTIELDTAFQTLLYDLYSKDVSVKVKASVESRCARGEYVFGQAPFGYEKSRAVKNSVIVNESEAEIVRYIFSLGADGKSCTQIARQLYEEKVPTITQLRNPHKQYQDSKVHSWSENAVRRILNNRFYLGEMAYGKSVRKAVGSKSSIAVAREDWKVIPNHHEALISEEIFERAASYRQKRPSRRECRAVQKDKKHPLTGKIFCGGCGYALAYKPLCGGNRYRRFECRKHALLGIPECCTGVSAGILEETVLLMLKKELMILGSAGKQKERLSAFQQASVRALKKRLELYRREKKKLQTEKDILYERYAMHRFDELREHGKEEYQIRAGGLTQRMSDLSVKENEASQRLAAAESECAETTEDMKQIVRLLHIEELTKEAVDTFIRRVCVYNDKRIEIEWNFKFLTLI